MSPWIAEGAAAAARLMMFESACRLLVPDMPCAASACDSFDPSEISCVQFFAELNDEEDDDDDEDDEDDEEDADELVVEPGERSVVVGGADDLLLPPHPAASTASTVTREIPSACLMPSGEPTAFGAAGLEQVPGTRVPGT